MASSGIINGTQQGTRPYLRISWEVLQTDIPNNRKQLQLILYLVSPYNINFSAPKQGVLQGVSFTYTKGMKSPGTVELYRRTIWVTHNADGTKTQALSASFNIAIQWGDGWIASLSVSGNAILDDIPRASKIDSFKFTGALQPGTSTTIQLAISRASPSFTHDISLRDGSAVIASWNNQGIPTSLNLTANQVNDLLSRMNTVTSKSFTLHVQTKSGSTKIGNAVTANATATVSSTVLPIAKDLYVTIDGNGRDKQINKYVQNISRVYATFTGGATGGASIASRKIVVSRIGGSDSQTINNYYGTTSKPVTLSGTYEVIATTRDTRGREATTRAEITVHAYNTPRITDFTVVRDVDTPTKAIITRQGTFTDLGGDNPVDIRIERAQGGTWLLMEHSINYSGTISGSSEIGGNTVVSSYEYRIIVKDSFNNSASAYANIPTQKVVMDIYRDEGVSIGKLWEQGALDIAGSIYIDNDPFTLRTKRVNLPANGQITLTHTDGNFAYFFIVSGTTVATQVTYFIQGYGAGDSRYRITPIGSSSAITTSVSGQSITISNSRSNSGSYSRIVMLFGDMPTIS